MIKKAIPYIFVCLAVLVVCSGRVAGQSFRGGVMAGMTASEVSGDRSGGPNKVGWYASVFTDYPVSDFSFLHLELMVIQKGSREFHNPDDPSQGAFRDYRFHLQYVEIPVLFKIQFPVARRLPYTNWLGGEMGLSVSRVIGHVETDDVGVEITNTPNDVALTRPFRPAELNLILGFSVPLGEMLAFTFRFNQGLTPIRDHASGKQVWYNRGQYNTAWTLGMSVTVF